MDKISIFESENRIAVLCKLAYIIDNDGVVSIKNEADKEYIKSNWTALEFAKGREKVLNLMQKSLKF